MAVLTYYLGYIAEQNNFLSIVLPYALFFILYITALTIAKDAKTIRIFLITGILLRFLLLFAMPNLSDDVYRFIWDGRLIMQGVNPFDFTPTEIMQEGLSLHGINQELYNQLNSQEYYTIYPPVDQAVFTIATWVSPNSIWGSMFVMKLFLFVCELGTITLMSSASLRKQIPNNAQALAQDSTAHTSFTGFARNAIFNPNSAALLYALNPLIIIEICGNIHFEGAMVFFLLLALYLLHKSKEAFSAGAMALSIASKLLPLMFLPLLVRTIGWRRSFTYWAIAGMVLLLLFFPLFNSVFFANFGDSLNLYFRRFEFNASMYYIFRYIGWQIKGYNWIAVIGPALACATFIAILAIAYFKKQKTIRDLTEAMLFAICVYLFLGTTVHPWYLSLPIVLCVFTRFRFPIVWSAVVVLSYAKYSMEDWYLLLVAVEYFVVFAVVAMELHRRK